VGKERKEKREEEENGLMSDALPGKATYSSIISNPPKIRGGGEGKK